MIHISKYVSRLFGSQTTWQHLGCQNKIGQNRLDDVALVIYALS